MKAGTPFSIIFESIHHDAKEWIEPHKFDPLRFDANSLSKCGRNPLAFTPHMGGKRICLGKTFAEMAARHTISLLLFYFDFALPQTSVSKPSYSILGKTDIELWMTVNQKKLLS